MFLKVIKHAERDTCLYLVDKKIGWVRQLCRPPQFCVTSIYAGIALSLNFVASASSVIISIVIMLSIPNSISEMAGQIQFKFGMWM